MFIPDMQDVAHKKMLVRHYEESERLRDNYLTQLRDEERREYYSKVHYYF